MTLYVYEMLSVKLVCTFNYFPVFVHIFQHMLVCGQKRVQG